MDEPWWRNGREPLRAALIERLREPGPTSVLVVDLDHFLWFNDTNGHRAGDAALWRVGMLLVDFAGEGVFRTAGAVYSIWLPQADACEAAITAERLRVAVAELRIDNPKAPGPGWLTVSIGGATSSVVQPCSAEHLIELATDRCYQAKVAGRNRVVCEPGA